MMDFVTSFQSTKCLWCAIALVCVSDAWGSEPVATSFGPDRWETWSSRAELAPKTSYSSSSWSIRSDGSDSCHGGWDLHWAHIDGGRRYRVSIACDADDIPSIHDSVHAELFWWDSNGDRIDWAHVKFEKVGPRLFEFVYEGNAPANAQSATLRVMLRWTDRGRVTWKQPALSAIDPPEPNKIRVAIATGDFPGTSVDDNLNFALKLINQSADAGARVVCLPECVTTWRINDIANQGARPIPGQETRVICDLARKRGIDVVLTMNELDGKHIYNTGLYIDADKGIVGKYRKVHLSVGERWRGKTPGREFPVWDTHYGQAGMLICYDNVHPEGHRILAQKGAQVIFLPIMGDPRVGGPDSGNIWDRIMQIRALDNHVWFVVCQNKGEWGAIINPAGEIVAKVNPDTGIAIAEMDLSVRYQSAIGSDFENRNWGERRPSLYHELLEDE